MKRLIQIRKETILDEKWWPELVKVFVLPLSKRQQLFHSTTDREYEAHSSVDYAIRDALLADPVKVARFSRQLNRTPSRKKRRLVPTSYAARVLAAAIAVDMTDIFREFIVANTNLLMRYISYNLTVFELVLIHHSVECFKNAAEEGSEAPRLHIFELLEELSRHDLQLNPYPARQSFPVLMRELSRHGSIDFANLSNYDFNDVDRYVCNRVSGDGYIYRKRTYAYICALRDRGAKIFDAQLNSGLSHEEFVEKLSEMADIGVASDYIDALFAAKAVQKRRL